MSNFNPTDDELMRAAMGDLDGGTPTQPPKPPVPPKPPILSNPPQSPKPPKKKSKAIPIIAAVMAVVVIAIGVAAFMNGQSSGPDYYYDGDGNGEGYVDNNDDGIAFGKVDEAYYYSASVLSVGDPVELGMYPQSEVTDVRLVAYLDDQSVNMTSFDVDDVTYSYGDFEYEGTKYRRVNWTRDSDYLNGYEKEVNYYFKWEPITWKIIGEVDGEWQLFCDKVIDVHEMDLDSNYWANSGCRDWMSNSFVNEAFSKYERSVIEATDTSVNGYSSKDKVYLLSADEITDAHFGFTIGDPFFYADEDPNRKAKRTEYVRFFDGSYGSYFLRTVEDFNDEGEARYYYVDCSEGYVKENRYGGGEASRILGIRPACRISKNAQLPI